MTKTGLEFWILVIEICLRFEICYLDFFVFPILHNSINNAFRYGVGF
jgi:hypothetical protein